MNYPILMADIKGSRKKNGKLLIAELKDVVAYINKMEKEQLKSPLTITLGDEFQGVITSIEAAIQIIIQIEEYIIHHQFNLKLRYVLNYGKIETKINPHIAYEMLGEGLTKARTQINELKKSEARFLIAFNDKQRELERLINQAFSIYESFVDDWKIGDYTLISAFLIHKDYKLVAQHVKLDPSSAWRRKKSLKIEQYETVKNIILDLSKKFKK